MLAVIVDYISNISYKKEDIDDTHHIKTKEGLP